MNLKGKMKKLQTAIVNKGKVVKINTRQFYSKEQSRMITTYIVCTQVPKFSKKKKEMVLVDEEILRTSSMVDVVLCLSEMYMEVSKGT